MPTRNGSTRREFLGHVAIGAAVLGAPRLARAERKAGGAAAFPPAAAATTRFAQKGAVVRVARPGALGSGGSPPAELVRRMVDRAVMELTGQAKAADAWALFAKPEDTVLLKPNGFGFPAMAAHPATTYAIVAALRDVGVPEQNIVIYDQYQSRLGASGYKVTPVGAKGVRVLTNKQIGYEATPRRHPMGRVNLALPVLAASVIIDIPVIKDHDLSGVTCAMKNITHGVVQQPGALHKGGCAAIPGVWALSEIKDKVKLVICDAFKLVYDGGPHDRPRNKVLYDSVFATTDPVAMDRLAWDAVEEVRKAKGKPTLTQAKRPPRFIEAAAALGLGVGARAEIKLTELRV
jgi:uncharacterized protein (DUF362 family)